MGSITTHVRIDPLYEGVIDPESVHIPEPIQVADENDLGLAESSGIEYAADAFRKAADARQKYLNVYLTMDTYDPSEAWEAVYYAGVAHSGIPTEGDYIRYNVLSVGGSTRYMGYDGGYLFYLSYEFTYTDTATQEAIMDAAVEDLLDELDLWDASHYDKVRGVYDYICDNVTYDHQHLEYGAGYPLMFSAYAALVNKTAVCQGYATLFYRLESCC